MFPQTILVFIFIFVSIYSFFKVKADFSSFLPPVSFSFVEPCLYQTIHLFTCLSLCLHPSLSASVFPRSYSLSLWAFSIILFLSISVPPPPPPKKKKKKKKKKIPFLSLSVPKITSYNFLNEGKIFIDIISNQPIAVLKKITTILVFIFIFVSIVSTLSLR